ncbi:MAG: hypothetical protein OXF26_10040 [Alphaproteobacteria bacterium]|nr:hypothetical protein [Alphaproteobacteria bacterium]MCY4319657.1 hypothetical protein [Alphaproteobacteria bacterium]
MAKITLTASRMEALKPRKATYDVRHTKLRGFGMALGCDADIVIRPSDPDTGGKLRIVAPEPD